MIEKDRYCPCCAGKKLILDKAWSRYRVRCDCGFAVQIWHRDPVDAWALFDLIVWQIEHDKNIRRIDGTLKITRRAA